MLSFLIGYIVAGLATVGILTAMILIIGRMQENCPTTGPAAKLVSMTAASGFASIGAGGVLIISFVIPMMPNQPLIALLGALGLAAICLGLGFTHAVNTMRLVLAGNGARKSAADPT